MTLNLDKKNIPEGVTAVLVLNDGSVFFGYGFGAETTTVSEICFNTAITGYQEIMTDPSYAGQSITFTFPHIGNVGTNDEDFENFKPISRGAILRADISEPSNWRNMQNFDSWLKKYDIPAISGVDTRHITTNIRDNGAPHGVICHDKSGNFDLQKLYEKAKSWSGLKGLDLAKEVCCKKPYEWNEKLWKLGDGYVENQDLQYHIVVIDYGIKRNILRNLSSQGCKITVVPATTTAQEILAYNPDGILLSNGPGDPAATGEYAVPVIQELIASGKPIFGICLGHQILALALGGKTEKMHLGHRGANHPIKDLTTGKVEITSQNHGFVVNKDSLPDNVEITHYSLFDGSLAGIAIKNQPVFSVQYHPEASPGPEDSHYLFKRFINYLKAR